MGAVFTLGLFGVVILITVVLVGMFIMGTAFLVIGICMNKRYKKTGQRKNYPVVFVIIGSVFVVASLFFSIIIVNTATLNDSGEEYVSPERKFSMQCEVIVESIKNKDAESVKELFCERVKNRPEIDDEINNLFEFVDGNIISYDEPYPAGYSGRSDSEGTVERKTSADIRNIRTDTNKIYEIRIYYEEINRKIPDRVGITEIGVYDVETRDEYGKMSCYKISIGN